MEQRPKIMNIGNMISATELAKMFMQNVINHAESLTKDPEKKERMNRHECKSCFYGSRIGGQAFTDRDCMSCGETQTYSSTETDVLCMPCAVAGKLCKRRGGDIDLRVRRKEWPTSTVDAKYEH